MAWGLLGGIVEEIDSGNGLGNGLVNESGVG